MHRPGRLRRLHRPLTVVLLGIVGLSVIPLGSNRPFFWAFWSAIIGLAGLIYVVSLAMMRSQAYTSLRSVKLLSAAYGIICLTLIAQLLPLGSLYWNGGLGSGGTLLPTPPFISTTPGDTFLMLLRWFSFGMLFYLSLQVASNAPRRLLMLQTLLAVMAGHAVLAILSYYQWGNTLLGAEKWTYIDSITGTFVNRNSFATFMALGLTITAAMTLHALENRRGVHLLTALATYALYAIFIIGALLGSNSRMGLVVAIVGALTVMICHVAGRQKSSLRMIIGAVFVALLIGATAYTYQTGVWLRFLELESSGTLRLRLYAQVWDMIQAAPFLGYGGGSFAQGFQLFHDPALNVELVWDRAHNTYLTLWSELGLVVGSLPILLVALISFFSLRAMRRSASADPALTVWIGCAVVAALHSLVDFSFEMYATALTFTMLGALAMASALERKNRA
mgnify:CR=1 FL=1